MSMKQPLLIYDGDCGFCQKSANLIQRWSNGRIPIQPWQRIPQQMAALGLTAEDGLTQVWFVDANGRLTGGAEAVNEAMKQVWWVRPFTILYRLPGLHQLQNRAYRWVAHNRYKLPGSTAACAISPKESGR